MNYFISRGDQQYGPYSLAELQRYVQQGNIALTDLARSEGMTDWVPVSQVIGNISISQPGAYGAPASPYGSPATPYGSPAAPYGAPGAYTPQQLPAGSVNPPPSLHWALVLVFAIISCGIFFWIWAIVEAAWVRKIRSENAGLYYYIISLVLYYGASFSVAFLLLSHTFPREAIEPIRWGGSLVAWAIHIAGSFKIKDALEDYYNREEPIGLRLSGPMTFFFGVYYFQYHFNQIHQMKQAAFMGAGPGAYRGQY